MKKSEKLKPENCCKNCKVVVRILIGEYFFFEQTIQMYLSLRAKILI